MKSLLCKRKAMKRKAERIIREATIKQFEQSIMEARLYPNPNCPKCYGRGYLGRDVKTNLMKPCRCLHRIPEITPEEMEDTYGSPPVIDPAEIKRAAIRESIKKLLWWVVLRPVGRFIYSALKKKIRGR